MQNEFGPLRTKRPCGPFGMGAMPISTLRCLAQSVISGTSPLMPYFIATRPEMMRPDLPPVMPCWSAASGTALSL